MEDIKLTEDKMHPSNKITAEEYFDGSFGINHSDDQKPEVIRIKVYGAQVEYVRALPIHESQKEIEVTSNGVSLNTGLFRVTTSISNSYGIGRN